MFDLELLFVDIPYCFQANAMLSVLLWVSAALCLENRACAFGLVDCSLVCCFLLGSLQYRLASVDCALESALIDSFIEFRIKVSVKPLEPCVRVFEAFSAGVLCQCSGVLLTWLLACAGVLLKRLGQVWHLFR